MPSNLTIKAVLKKYLKGFIIEEMVECNHFFSFIIFKIERQHIF